MATHVAWDRWPLHPLFATPVLVGGFIVGQPVVVGSAFVVGGTSRSGAAPSSRYQSRDFGRTGGVGLIAPFYLPATSPVVEDVILTSASSAGSGELAYYAFRPWYPVGNALMAGVPVFLPAPSTFDESNTSRSVSEGESDAGSDPVVTAPRIYANEIGGISFSITPVDAAVYVDGKFVGSASDYSPSREPLLLRFGSYEVELRARGYATERFAVSVAMGEVMPFAGGLVKAE